MLTKNGSDQHEGRRPGAPPPRSPEQALPYGSGMTLVFHWGGPRHGEVDKLPMEALASSTLVYDGPKWFGVYEQFQPVRKQATPQGQAEVWVVRE